MKTFFVCLQSNSKGRAFGYLLFVGKTSVVDHYCRAFRLIVNNIDLQYRKSFTGALKEFLAVVSLQWQSFFLNFVWVGPGISFYWHHFSWLFYRGLKQLVVSYMYAFFKACLFHILKVSFKAYVSISNDIF